MIMEAASIAQHCKTLRLSSDRNAVRIAGLKRRASRTTRIFTIWKLYSSLRSRTANGARSNCASRMLTCRG